MCHDRLIVFQLAEVAVSIDLFGHPAALNPVASGSQLSVHEDKRDGWVIEREVLVLTRFRGPQRAPEGRIPGGVLQASDTYAPPCQRGSEGLESQVQWTYPWCQG